MLQILVLAAIPALLVWAFGPPVAYGHFHRGGTAARRLAAQFNLWHIMVTVPLAAILLAALLDGPPGGRFAILLVVLLVLTLFLRTWRSEFVFAMSLRDDELPGQFDKLIWVFLLLAMPPLGLWLFRSYRLAHWPEPEPEVAGGKPVADLF